MRRCAAPEPDNSGDVDRRIAASLLVLAACRPAAEPPTVEHEAAGKAAPGVGPLARVTEAATVHMPSHFIDVLDVHRALVRGGLADAQAAAAHLEQDRPDVMLEDWAPHLLATQAAAARVRQAKTLAEADPAAAALAASCGACHLALGVRLRPTESLDPPPAGDDEASAMHRHAWAFNRLWESLVLPSDASWASGAAAFVELPACDDTPSSETDLAAIARAREDTRALASQARAASTADARVEVYGRMLGTCAACHGGGC